MKEIKNILIRNPKPNLIHQMSSITIMFSKRAPDFCVGMKLLLKKYNPEKFTVES